MNDQSHYRVSVKGIVIDNTKRFLLSKKNNGKWDFLGGGINHNEDPIEALRREVKEETGLEIIYISPTPKYFITASKFKREGYIANVIYEIKLRNLEFTPSDECVEFRFFSSDEAKKEDIYPQVEIFIKVFNPRLHTN